MPIPPGIADLWQVLDEETVWAHAYWQVYLELFNGPKDQVELLNSSGSFFFQVVQNALSTEVQMKITRLADPLKTGNHENATVKRLLQELTILEPHLEANLRPLCQRFIATSEPVREMRDKVIAHLDLSTATKIAPPPPDVTIEQVRSALHALAEFMNATAIHFGETPTHYEMFGMMGRGPKDLMFLLRKAHRYLKLQESGKIDWSDDL